MLDLNKPLVTDADDVMLNWLMGGFRPFVEKTLGYEICANGPLGWDMSSWTGVSYEDTVAMIKEFNASTDFGRIPAFDCATTMLPLIADTGRKIHVVTSCAADPEIHKMRRKNLETAFGPIFDSITCLDLGVSKAPALAKIAEEAGSAGVWAEDNHKNGKAGADLGYQTFMFRRSHNRDFEPECDHPLITWVDDWHALKPTLLAA